MVEDSLAHQTQIYIFVYQSPLDSTISMYVLQFMEISIFPVSFCLALFLSISFYQLFSVCQHTDLRYLSLPFLQYSKRIVILCCQVKVIFAYSILIRKILHYFFSSSVRKAGRLSILFLSSSMRLVGYQSCPLWTNRIV